MQLRLISISFFINNPASLTSIYNFNKNKMSKKPPSIFLTNDEATAIQMALGTILEDFESTEKTKWNVEAQKYRKDIKAAATSAALKIQRITGITHLLPRYKEGDEDEFINPLT